MTEVMTHACSLIELSEVRTISSSSQKSQASFRSDQVVRGDTVFDQDDGVSLYDTSDLQGNSYLSVIQDAVEGQIEKEVADKSRQFALEREELQRKLAEKESQLQSLRESSAKTIGEKDSLIASKEDAFEVQSQEISKLTTALRSVQLKNTEYTEENRDLKVQINDLIKENGKQQRENRKKTEEVEQKAAFTVSQLQAERDKHRETAKKLEEFVLKESVAEESRAENRQKLNDLKRELSKERDLASQLKQDKECLERNVAMLQQQLDSQAKQLETSHTASLELASKLSPIKGRQGGEDLGTDSGATHFNIQSIKDADETLCPISMNVVIEYRCQMTPHWEALGHGLSIDSSEIQTLRNHTCSPESKCIQILEKWFERGTDVSWKRFLGVLMRLKLPSLVSAICSDHQK